jgi:HEAT repeat protein
MKLFERNISKLRKKRKVKQLIKLLNHPRDSRIREKAAEALGWIGDASAVYPLIPILKEEHFTVRIAAAEALGRIGDASAVNPLNSILKDEHPSVRKAAAEALVNIWKPSIESLIIALKYDDLFVCEAAAEALESIGWKPKQEEAGARFWIAKKEWV